MKFKSKQQYFLMMLYSLVALCGGGVWVDAQLETNYFGFQSDHLDFIKVCQLYGYSLIMSAFLLSLLLSLHIISPTMGLVSIAFLLLAWIVGCVSIVHQYHVSLSLPKKILGRYGDSLSLSFTRGFETLFSYIIVITECIRSFSKPKLLSLLFFSFLCFSSGFVSAQVNLSLNQLVMNGGTDLYQNTSPTVNLIIENNGSSPATVISTTPLASGFITCTVGGVLVFSSNPITTLIINANSSIQFPISLSTIATQTIGNGLTLTCNLASALGWNIINPSQSLTFSVLEKPIGRFDLTLDRVKQPISDKLDGGVAELGIGGVKSRAYGLIDKLAVPGAVLVGIFFALVAMYQIMFKQDKDDPKKIIWLVFYAVIGILLMLSAKFIGRIFYEDIFFSGEIGVDQFNAVNIVAQAYDLLLYPFLKIFYYLAMGVLFVILLMRVFSFVTEASDDVVHKSRNIIVATTVGLLVIIGAKQLIEGVYGREAQIRNGNAVTITDVGGSFLNDANIPIIYLIIQRVMGLAGFAVLAIILYQTFKMLTDPTNEENLSGIRKTVLYVVLGMLVIGAGYLIVNVVMLN